MENFLNNKELKKSPFTVPDNYFDNIADRVIDEIQVERKSTKKIIYLRMMVSLTSAAALLLIGLMVWQYFYVPQQDTIASTNDSELLIDLDYYQIDESMVVDFVSSDYGVIENENIEDNLDEEISSSEIIDYLVDEDISLTQIADLY